jgi:flagellar biogenesis protein FliO
MESLQQAVSIIFVLALLVGVLYWLRTKGLASLTSRAIGRRGERRMEAIERLQLTPHHSLHLVRVAGRMLLFAVSPSGCSIVDDNPCAIRSEDQMAIR